MGQRFLHDDVRIGPNGNTGIQATNLGHLLLDQRGGLYVLYAAAGMLHLAYSPPGPHSTSSDWRDIPVLSDPQIAGGNVADRYYGIARGGAIVYALYAKPSEGLSSLYLRLFADGKPLAPEVALKSTTTPNTFEYVSGLRDTQTECGGRAITWGRASNPPAGPGTVSAWALGLPGRASRYGVSCASALPLLPRLSTETIPEINASLALELRRAPASAPCVMLVGQSCLVQPIDLGPAGLTGCQLHAPVQATIAFGVDGAGHGSLALSVPNDPSLGNKTLLFQSLVLAPGANSASAVTTNGVAATF